MFKQSLTEEFRTEGSNFAVLAKECAVPAKLVARPGQVHGGGDIVSDFSLLADWFDEYLRGINKP